MIESLRRVLEGDERVAYALLFGSRSAGTAHAHSDLDVAIGPANGRRLTALELGAVAAAIESATAVPAHVVSLDDATPGLAYRVFQKGTPIFIGDEAAFKNRLARAVLEYLDFKPIEDVLTRGVLAARHGR